VTCSETTFPARLFPGKISGNSAAERVGRLRHPREELASYSFRHVPPTQLSPIEQLLPHRPQFWESPTKVALSTHLPMHRSEPGAQPQKPPVHVSEKEHWLPQRPQFWRSFTNVIVSTHRPWHQASPAAQLPAPIPGVWAGGGLRGTLPVLQPSNRTAARQATLAVLVAIQ